MSVGIKSFSWEEEKELPFKRKSQEVKEYMGINKDTYFFVTIDTYFMTIRKISLRLNSYQGVEGEAERVRGIELNPAQF